MRLANARSDFRSVAKGQNMDLLVRPMERYRQGIPTKGIRQVPAAARQTCSAPGAG